MVTYMNKPRFKAGDIVVGNALSNKYSLTRENTLWVVMEYFQYNNNVPDEMDVVEYTGPTIEGFIKVKKNWHEDYFCVVADCFDILKKENEHLLYLLKE